MTLVYILLAAILGVSGYAAWRVTMGGAAKTDETGDKVLREMLESLRREITDSKDKLQTGMTKNAESVQQRLEKTLDLVNKQLGGMDNRIDKRVSEINNRLDSAAKLMGQVQKQYGNVEQLSGSIKQLQEAFKAPKPRGNFSEKILVDLASQSLPVQAFEAQHTFKTGAIVDLLIKTAHGHMCVDAKFPLENYLKLIDLPEDVELRRLFRSDVKKHIKDVSKKYILPEEGTLEFAFLYVPSDAVFYEILTDSELCEAAEAQRVCLLSPHSFHYFLNIVRQAYQSQQFADNAKQILGLIRGIQQQSGNLGEELRLLQKHMGHATNSLGSVHTSYGKLDMQIAQAGQLEGAGDAPLKIEAAFEKVATENLEMAGARAGVAQKLL